MIVRVARGVVAWNLALLDEVARLPDTLRTIRELAEHAEDTLEVIADSAQRANKVMGGVEIAVSQVGTVGRAVDQVSEGVTRATAPMRRTVAWVPVLGKVVAPDDDPVDD